MRPESSSFSSADAERELSTEHEEHLAQEMDRFARTHAPGGHLEWLWDLGEQLVCDHTIGHTEDLELTGTDPVSMIRRR